MRHGVSRAARIAFRAWKWLSYQLHAALCWRRGLAQPSVRGWLFTRAGHDYMMRR